MNKHTNNSSPPPLWGRSDRAAIREGGNASAHRAVRPMLRMRAKTLRREMTEAEQRLWNALRAHRLEGLSFRRQVPFGAFIADFVCHERRIVIEVDGGQHADSKRDLWRDRRFNAKGYRVLRFWNTDVLQNLSGVLQTIVEATRDHTPLPSPPPQGGRERGNASGEVTS